MSVLRFFIRLLRSHGGPNQVALAAALGVFVGVMPWYGSHMLVWLLAFLLLRLSPLAFATSVALCKALALWLPLEQLSYDLGRLLLDQTSPRLVSWWQGFASLPGVSLFELDRYVMLGSLLLASLGAVMFYLLTRVVYRRFAASKLSKKCKDSKLLLKIATLLWENKPCAGNVFLRGQVILGLLVLVVLALATLALIGNMLLKQGLQERGGEWLGVPVSAEEISYNLWDNKLLLQGFAVRDPWATDKNLLTVAWMELHFAPKGLRRGQLIFEKIMARDVTIRLCKNDKGEFNFNALKPVARNNAYAAQVSSIDWDMLQLPAESQKIVQATTLTWREELRKWLLQQMAIARCKQRLRLSRLEEYGQTQKAPSDVLDALINLPTLQRTEQALQQSPESAKLQSGRPHYLSRYRPWLVCQRLEAANVKLEYAPTSSHSELYSYSLAMENTAGHSLIRDLVTQTLAELDKLDKK